MASAGFYRCSCPKHTAASKMPAEASRVFETLAQADASCGWVAFISAASGSVLARLPDVRRGYSAIPRHCCAAYSRRQAP